MGDWSEGSRWPQPASRGEDPWNRARRKRGAGKWSLLPCLPLALPHKYLQVAMARVSRARY